MTRNASAVRRLPLPHLITQIVSTLVTLLSLRFISVWSINHWRLIPNPTKSPRRESLKEILLNFHVNFITWLNLYFHFSCMYENSWNWPDLRLSRLSFTKWPIPRVSIHPPPIPRPLTHRPGLCRPFEWEFYNFLFRLSINIWIWIDETFNYTNLESLVHLLRSSRRSISA